VSLPTTSLASKDISMRTFYKLTIVLTLSCILAGCVAKIPKDALQLPPQSLQERQLQTRYFETGDEQALLVASSQVLQDLGFNLEESETELGVITGKKHRDARDGGQIAGKIAMAILFGVNVPTDVDQIIRVSLVTKPLDFNKKQTENVTDKLRQKLTRKIREKTQQVLRNELSTELEGRIQENIISSIVDDLSDDFGSEVDEKLKEHLNSGRVAVRITFQRLIYNENRQVSRRESIKDVAVYQEFFSKLGKSVFLEANNI